jgi:hypothetical protein
MALGLPFAAAGASSATGMLRIGSWMPAHYPGENHHMKRLFLVSVVSALSLYGMNSAFAADTYNEPPAGDPQVQQCKVYSNNKWEGGTDKSPIAGQTKAEAFCTCMWNETPDDFKGSLAKFSETAKGAATNAVCEKYSDWHG